MDSSLPEKRMSYYLRSSAKAAKEAKATKAANLMKTAEKSKPAQSRYMLRSTIKRNASAIEYAEPQRKRKRIASKQLMDLNDECLLKIIEHVSLVDLCNLAETNQRLYDWTIYNFSCKYKVFKCIWLMDKNHGRIDLETFERLVRIFGHHIVSMKISTSRFVEEANISESLLLLISRYCVGKLKTLKLDNFTIRSSIDARCHEMFDRLNHFVLKSSWFDWISMKRLKSLTLFDVGSHWKFVSLPKIRDVMLWKLKYIQTENLVEFLTLNRSIKYLMILQPTGISAAMCKAIGEMKDLYYLELRCYGNITSEEIFQQDLKYLSSLKKLTSLKLNCMKCSVSSLLAKFITNDIGLVNLQLINGSLDTYTFEIIKNLKTLKVLSFDNMDDITNSRIMSLANEMPLLAEFYIRSNSYITQTAIRALVRDSPNIKRLKINTPHFELDSDTYHEMLSAIQKRPETCLQLEICNDKQNLVLSDVINGPNRKWLRVKVAPWHKYLSTVHFDSDYF